MTLHATCFQPEVPPDRTLSGVLLEVLDFRGQRIVESNHALGEEVVIPGLPYFSTLDVKIRALYKQGDDVIESADRELQVETGVTGWFRELASQVPKVVWAPSGTSLGFTWNLNDIIGTSGFGFTFDLSVQDVAEPEIVKLMAVNGTTALIHWYHDAPKAAAFSYLISKNDNDTVEVDHPGVDSVLLTDLVPERTYVMKVSAFIHYEGKHYHQDSEEKSLKMLPKGLIEIIRLETFDCSLLNSEDQLIYWLCSPVSRCVGAEDRHKEDRWGRAARRMGDRTAS